MPQNFPEQASCLHTVPAGQLLKVHSFRHTQLPLMHTAPSEQPPQHSPIAIQTPLQVFNPLSSQLLSTHTPLTHFCSAPQLQHSVRAMHAPLHSFIPLSSQVLGTQAPSKHFCSSLQLQHSVKAMQAPSQSFIPRSSQVFSSQR